MDLQRTLLIGAIGVLSFMLLINWEAFKECKDGRHSARNVSPAPDQQTKARRYYLSRITLLPWRNMRISR
jgi:hypothetical protein